MGQRWIWGEDGEKEVGGGEPHLTVLFLRRVARVPAEIPGKESVEIGDGVEISDGRHFASISNHQIRGAER